MRLNAIPVTKFLLLTYLFQFSCGQGNDGERSQKAETLTDVVLRKEREDVRAEVSPDRQWIAFTSRDAGSRANYGLYIVRSDGTGLKRLLHNDSLYMKAPKWSPDGGKIAFSYGKGEAVDIYKIGKDGSDLVRLTAAEGVDAEPAWSPDGTEIVFHSNRSGRYQLMRMDKDGNNQRPMLAGEANDYIPDWSINNQIVFTSDRSGSQDIWVMDLDGSGLRPLTSFPEREIAPVWSSDARMIAFHKNTIYETSEGKRNNWDIYTIYPDGSEVRRITFDRGEDLFPTWYGDQLQLLITSQKHKGLFRLYIANLNDAEIIHHPVPLRQK